MSYNPQLPIFLQIRSLIHHYQVSDSQSLHSLLLYATNYGYQALLYILTNLLNQIDVFT